MSNITVSAAVDTLLVKSTLGDIQAYLLASPTLTGTVVVNGGTSGGLSVVGSTIGGGNALGITAGANNKFSAICFFDFDSGIEHGAIGWGNSTVGGLLQDKFYLELSDLSGGSGAPLNGGAIVQTSFTTHGLGSYAWVPRIEFGADLGPLVLTGYDQATHASATLTITNLGAFFVDATNGLGTLGYDANACFVFRNGNDSNAGYSYGGTLASGKGWLFKTGGVAGSQIIRLQIADDGIAASVQMNLNAGAAITVGSDATGDVFYRSSGGILARLGIGSTGKLLTVVGGLPSWVTYTGSSSLVTTGTLTSGTAGTGFVIARPTMTLGSDATGDIYYRNSGGILTRLPIGSDGDTLKLSGGLPSWVTGTPVSGPPATVVASGNSTAQSATNNSVATYTTPNDSTVRSFRVGAYTAITAISAGTLTITVVFTDENGTSQTITYFPMGLTSAGLTTTGFTGFAPVNIRCNPNTAITVKATFTGVSITYDAGGTIESLY